MIAAPTVESLVCKGTVTPRLSVMIAKPKVTTERRLENALARFFC
jgi:hypothetical protein